MTHVIIDFEFTGLDNNFITDNEIVQMKLAVIEQDFGMEVKKRYCNNYCSNKPIGVHTLLFLHTERFENDPPFDKVQFEGLIPDQEDVTFYGFGIQQDIKMLAKYGIYLENYIDLREELQRSMYAQKMATEGSNLECVYYILTGKCPNHSNHLGIEELDTIVEIYHRSRGLILDQYIKYMPHGFCSGMPLDMYVVSNRRQADGYRFNNNDLLSKSLTHYIDLNEVDRDEPEDWI